MEALSSPIHSESIKSAFLLHADIVSIVNWSGGDQFLGLEMMLIPGGCQGHMRVESASVLQLIASGVPLTPSVCAMIFQVSEFGSLENVDLAVDEELWET